MAPPDTRKGFGPATVGAAVTVACLATIGFCVLVVRAVPRSELAPPKIEAVTMATSTAGVQATITAGDVTITRSLPTLNFRLEPGETLDPRLPSGPFTAVLTVAIRPGRSRQAQLGAHLQGGQLTIRRGDGGDGEILLTDAAGDDARVAMSSPVQPVRLRAPRETLTYEFNRTGEGPVALRGLWQPVDALVPLPLPTSGAPLLAEPALYGMMLAQEYHCVGCHQSADPQRQTLLATAPGPVLDDAGARVRPDWLRRWLADPAAVKPGTRMPQVELGDQELGDLVAYISSLGGPIAPETAAPDISLVRTGERSYHLVGCFACHGPLDRGGDDDVMMADEYAPLGALAQKTTVAQLAAFLRDPLASRPDGRMPAMGLSTLEAESIAAYLIAREQRGTRSGDAPRPRMPDTASAARGAAVFGASGCANCHTVTDMSPPALTAPPLESLQAGRGCLAQNVPDAAPRFALDPHERDALGAYLTEVVSQPHVHAPIDELAVRLEGMRCTACHTYLAAAGPSAAVRSLFATEGEADLGDEGRLPPDLSDAGGRLTTSWMHAVFEGDGVQKGERARPYLATRMPYFGDTVNTVPAQFAAAGGATDRLADEPAAFTTELAGHGRALVGADAFNCIQCHTIAGNDATGTPGPDLALMPGRLHPNNFVRWIADPARVRPGTRMPSLFVAGRSAFTDILGGDAVAQIGALWAYFSQGESLPLPDGLVDPSGYDLVVGDEPVVFRSFIKGAGVRAIACGFPEQVHCAFDADRGTVTLAWEGRFLSAQGAWGARGGSETNPESTAWIGSGPHPLAIAEPGESVAAAQKATLVRFRGYRLDEQKRPVFKVLLERGDRQVVVEEQPYPAAGAIGLRRRFAIDGPAETRIAVDTSDPAVRWVDGDGDDVQLEAGAERVVELEVTW